MSELSTSNALNMLLSVIVDYAGFFPPAKLELSAAMAAYAKYKTLSHKMLGRFVLPAARFREFTELVPCFDVQAWLLSVVLSSQAEVELEQICAFKHDAIQVIAFEFPVFPPDQIDHLAQLVPVGVERFFEVPFHQPLEIYLSTLQSAKGFAKVRTGGITPDAFPSIHQLSHFMITCAQYQLPFKATAGLHHPLHGEYRLTYEMDSATSPMHGFLNMAIAAALVYWQKISQEDLAELMGERSINAFQVEEDQLQWCSKQQKYSLSLTEIKQARQYFFRSFGSCSLEEPIQELAALNLL